MVALESPCVEGTELDRPETGGLSGPADTSLGQDIFNVSVEKIESKVRPDSIGNDVWRAPMAVIGIHSPVLPVKASYPGGTPSG